MKSIALSLALLCSCGGMNGAETLDPIAKLKKEIKRTVNDSLPYFVEYDPWECASVYVNKNNPSACMCEAHPGCIAEAATYNWEARGCEIYPRCMGWPYPTTEVDFSDNFPEIEGL